MYEHMYIEDSNLYNFLFMFKKLVTICIYLCVYVCVNVRICMNIAYHVSLIS